MKASEVGLHQNLLLLYKKGSINKVSDQLRRNFATNDKDLSLSLYREFLEIDEEKIPSKQCLIEK